MSQISHLNPLLDRRRYTKPVGRRVVALSVLVILLSGVAGWGVVTLSGKLINPSEVSLVDRMGHRPARPPLPTSPFVRR